MYQHRSYVLALDGAQKPKDMYVDESKKGLSFRPFDDILLLGGGSHRTGSHGPRFEENGKLINNPATDDKKA